MSKVSDKLKEYRNACFVVTDMDRDDPQDVVRAFQSTLDRMECLTAENAKLRAERDGISLDLAKADKQSHAFQAKLEEAIADRDTAINHLGDALEKAADFQVDAVAYQVERDAFRNSLREADAGLLAVRDLIDASYGVAGLHRNGDTAPWESLESGGTFEHWLDAFTKAATAAMKRKVAGMEEA